MAVIAETSWLLLDHLGPASQADLLRMITTGRLDVIDLTEADWARCLELIERYTDKSLDLIDASLVAVAERLGIATIATLNHRDFTVVRTRHFGAFELIP